MTGFNLYRLYRRAGNGPSAALRMAIGLLWRDLCDSLAKPQARPPVDLQRCERLDSRAEVERRARQRL